MLSGILSKVSDFQVRKIQKLVQINLPERKSARNDREKTPPVEPTLTLAKAVGARSVRDKIRATRSEPNCLISFVFNRFPPLENRKATRGCEGLYL